MFFLICISFEGAQPTETKFKVSTKVDHLDVQMLVATLWIIYLGWDWNFLLLRFQVWTYFSFEKSSQAWVLPYILPPSPCWKVVVIVTELKMFELNHKTWCAWCPWPSPLLHNISIFLTCSISHISKYHCVKNSIVEDKGK